MDKRLLVGGLIIALLVSSCNRTSVETPIPAPASEAAEIPSQAEVTEPSGPVLLNDLARDIKRTRRSGGFDNVGLTIGETAVDFTLKDVDGNTVSLRGLLSEKPVVMVFGSFT